MGAVAVVSSWTLAMPSVVAFGDDVGGTELAAEVGTGLVAAHQDDPLGAEPLGGQHRAQADGAVADHGDRRAPG